MTSATTSVLLVDDHEIVLAGLRNLLSAASGLSIAGEARTGAEAVEAALRLRPDVVLMDLELPDMTGVDACREILNANVTRSVVFISSHTDEQSVLSTFFAGAAGYLTKDIRGAALINAIESAAAGRPIIEPQVVSRLRQRMRHLSRESTPLGLSLDALTPQEGRILALVADGKTNKEIAAALALSDNTVKNYLSNTFQKLRVNRRAEAAARYAIEALGKRR